jgi:transcriptional regulator with XRE-family HTH domain
MTPAHCRAARGLLNWKQATLAEAAGLGLSTVAQFEQSGRAVSAETVQAIQRALESAGIEFLDGNEPGVQIRKGGPRGDPAAALPVEDLTAENDE